jgi:hypothetical protein
MQGRHEVKHTISLTQYYVLRQRLSAVLKPDPHVGADGRYHIRSLYLDTPEDTALREKLDGVRDRDKFRIRYYNNDTSLIQLEKKSKHGDLCQKQATRLDKTQAEAIACGDISWMKESEDVLLTELYCNMMQRRLRPKTIVDYVRDPFVYPAGNVRVTLDHDIRTGLMCTDFLNPDCVTIPVPDNPIILEVKWDAYLPDLVRDCVQLGSCRSEAYSKYAACRLYGIM